MKEHTSNARGKVAPWPVFVVRSMSLLVYLPVVSCSPASAPPVVYSALRAALFCCSMLYLCPDSVLHSALYQAGILAVGHRPVYSRSGVLATRLVDHGRPVVQTCPRGAPQEAGNGNRAAVFDSMCVVYVMTIVCLRNSASQARAAPALRSGRSVRPYALLEWRPRREEFLKLNSSAQMCPWRPYAQ